MKYAGVLFVCMLFFSSALTAQEISANSSNAAQDTAIALNLPPAFASATLAVPAPDAPAASPQVPVSVIPRYAFQLYGGYTFVRFYAYPGLEANRNGFDISASYFPRSGLFGMEGALTAVYGSLNNREIRLCLRRRWTACPLGRWARTGTLGPRSGGVVKFSAADRGIFSGWPGL